MPDKHSCPSTPRCDIRPRAADDLVPGEYVLDAIAPLEISRVHRRMDSTGARLVDVAFRRVTYEADAELWVAADYDLAEDYL